MFDLSTEITFARNNFIYKEGEPVKCKIVLDFLFLLHNIAFVITIYILYIYI